MFMRLVKCPDCDREISVAASTCPHCGKPMVPPQLPASSQGTPKLPTKIIAAKPWTVVVSLAILMFAIAVALFYFEQRLNRNPGNLPTATDANSAKPEAIVRAFVEELFGEIRDGRMAEFQMQHFDFEWLLSQMFGVDYLKLPLAKKETCVRHLRRIIVAPSARPSVVELQKKSKCRLRYVNKRYEGVFIVGIALENQAENFSSTSEMMIRVRDGKASLLSLGDRATDLVDSFPEAFNKHGGGDPVHFLDQIATAAERP